MQLVILLDHLISSAFAVDPASVATGITNVMSNPIPVAIGAFLVLILGFFMRSWIKPWLQKVQDKQNENLVKTTTQQSANDNDKLNQDFHP